MNTAAGSGRVGVARIAWLATLLLVVTGCATRETAAPPSAPPPAPAPNVRIGPPIELTNFDTGSDRFKVVIDADGLAHVVIATHAPGRVLEVVVRGDSVVERRSIPTQAAAPPSIDAAFDENHRLHALVGDEHWEFDGQAWRAGSPPPWRAFGVSVSRHYAVIWLGQVAER